LPSVLPVLAHPQARYRNSAAPPSVESPSLDGQSMWIPTPFEKKKDHTERTATSPTTIAAAQADFEALVASIRKR